MVKRVFFERELIYASVREISRAEVFLKRDSVIRGEGFVGFANEYAWC